MIAKGANFTFVHADGTRVFYVVDDFEADLKPSMNDIAQDIIDLCPEAESLCEEWVESYTDRLNRGAAAIHTLEGGPPGDQEREAWRVVARAALSASQGEGDGDG